MRHEQCETVVRRRSLFPWLAVLGCLVTWTVAGPHAWAAEDQQQKGVALIARAAQLEDLLSPGTEPFRLRAHVKLFGLVDGTREGQYLLMAASPTLWFESVRFPGYVELDGVDGGQRWRKRNVIDKPFRFYEVSRMFDLARHLRLPASAQIKRFAQKEIRGTQAFCFDASPTSDLWQKDSPAKAALTEVGISKDSSVTLCFDAATGALMSAMYSASLPRFEYEGQVALGNKVFPKVLRCYEGKELAAEAAIEELAPEQNVNPAGFKPPEGAETWPACESPGLPRLIEKKPLFGGVIAHAKAKGAFGTILCLAEVAPDGTIHDLAAVDWRGMLGELIREAVKGWRYAPATCNGVPVPMQIYIAYTFTP
jgi:Gram-negative bacterial TonB protein C-terminal